MWPTCLVHRKDRPDWSAMVEYCLWVLERRNEKPETCYANDFYSLSKSGMGCRASAVIVACGALNSPSKSKLGSLANGGALAAATVGRDEGPFGELLKSKIASSLAAAAAGTRWAGGGGLLGAGGDGRAGSCSARRSTFIGGLGRIGGVVFFVGNRVTKQSNKQTTCISIDVAL